MRCRRALDGRDKKDVIFVFFYKFVMNVYYKFGIAYLQLYTYTHRALYVDTSSMAPVDRRRIAAVNYYFSIRSSPRTIKSPTVYGNNFNVLPTR